MFCYYRVYQWKPASLPSHSPCQCIDQRKVKTELKVTEDRSENLKLQMSPKQTELSLLYAKFFRCYYLRQDKTPSSNYYRFNFKVAFRMCWIIGILCFYDSNQYLVIFWFRFQHIQVLFLIIPRREPFRRLGIVTPLSSKIRT